MAAEYTGYSLHRNNTMYKFVTSLIVLLLANSALNSLSKFICNKDSAFNVDDEFGIADNDDSEESDSNDKTPGEAQQKSNKGTTARPPKKDKYADLYPEQKRVLLEFESK